MEKIIITTPTELEAIFEKILDKRLPKSIEQNIEKTYSINQVAKMLKRSHKKITSLVASGILKITADNRIYESSLKEYINQK